MHNFTEIRVPGDVQVTHAYGISNNGKIVGQCFPVPGAIVLGVAGLQSFLYEAGAYSPIHLPGWDPQSLGVNNAGQVVGGYHVPSPRGPEWTPEGRGFLYHNGSYTTLAFPGAHDTTACGINDNGDIVGIYVNIQFDGTRVVSMDMHGFKYSSGNYETIDYPGAGGGTRLWGISNNGKIVGDYGTAAGAALRRGFVYDGIAFAELDAFGSQFSMAGGVNDDGKIAGRYHVPEPPPQGYRYFGYLHSGGVFAPLEPPGAIYSSAHGINNAGQVVGSYNRTSFLATPAA